MNNKPRLFEIDAELSAVLDNVENYDQATGELLPSAQEQAGNIEFAKQDKLIRTRNFFVSMKANMELAEQEKERINNYIRHLENVQKTIKKLLTAVVPEGQKVKDFTGNQIIGWRKSTQTIIDNEEMVFKYCLAHVPEAVVVPAPYLKKSVLKEIIEKGVGIEGVRLFDKQNIQLK